jgi:hypothetical protein
MARAEIDLRDRASGATQEKSLGQLVGEATSELSTLLRKEVELAKAELKQDVGAIGKGAGAFGAAGVVGYLSVFFLSVALMLGLGEAMPLWAAALVVGGLYLVAAAALGLLGKKSIGRANGAPRTIRTLKEDVEWARHPSS